MFGMRRPQQRAIQPVGPGMVGAHYLGGVALAAEQLVRAMLADIVEGAERAFAIPDDGDGLAGDVNGDERARLAQLLGMADPLPRLRDDFLQVDLIPAGVGV